ncbi:Glutathione transport system permease protein GsiD [Microbacterium azadirachtae]|uniref:Glutathione transport system permease protein GsiD n=1 Tax=Microbacterium azadirachtae TaxID=582680 RepID=A0A0F0L2H7_9MICO|nr:ABC transporter permease [Microbacterium azadirachtae]KJL26590.1 Glutathione transport system permease protein GsiD [Microbacterium azadirachtae]
MTMSTVAMATIRRRSRRRRPPALLIASIVFLVVIVLAAIFAPLIAPMNPNTTDILNASSGPSVEHWLGTDTTGRDILSRLLYGARLSLLAPLAVVILTTIVGAIVGLAAARSGGVVDLVLSRAMDIVFAFPSLLLGLLAVAIFGPGLTAPIIALAIGYIPFLGRIVRTATQQEQARPYIGSHIVMGFSSWWITVRHILPNIVPLLLAQATLAFGYAMLDIAALSYLGLGVQPPAADWGSMIAQSQSAVMQGQLWGMFWPSLAVILTVLSVNVLGEHLTDRTSARGRSLL